MRLPRDPGPLEVCVLEPQAVRAQLVGRELDRADAGVRWWSVTSERGLADALERRPCDVVVVGPSLAGSPRAADALVLARRVSPDLPVVLVRPGGAPAEALLGPRADRRVLRGRLEVLVPRLEGAILTLAVADGAAFALHHDPLTGLANRAGLDARLFAAGLEAGATAAVAVVDLDAFSAVNRALGPVAGDAALRRFAELLVACAGAETLVARLGADAFALVLFDPADQAEARARVLVDEVRERLDERMVVADAEVFLGLSAGTAATPGDADEARDLVRLASAAMREAKRSGGGTTMTHRLAAASNFELERLAPAVAGTDATRPSSPRAVAPVEAAELDAILAGRGVRSVFQPIVRLDSGRPVAFEALARGPEGSSLERPDLLFAAARAAGRTGELDWTCRAAALRGARELDAGLGLFVNVEPAALTTPCPAGLLPDWERARQRRVFLEVTERALTSAPAELLGAVGDARARGWGIALDDVGADVRSLALMPLLRPDVIKLDLRLVQERPSAEVAAIVNAVAAQREATGAIVLAEGIETEEHARVARSLGATLGQGWLFGRPGALGDSLPPPPDQRVEKLRSVWTPPGASAIEVVRGRRTLERADKRLLLQISLHLERQAAALGDGAILLGAFQEGDRFTGATFARYRTIARRAALVAALGVGMDAEPAPRVRGAHLAPDDVLRGEWSVVALGHHFAGALVAVDLGDTGPDADRRFDYAVVHDRELVVEAAAALVSRITPEPEPEPVVAHLALAG